MKYDIYGIGNALVDQEFEVSNDFLQDNNIQKGMMSLISHEEQRALVQQLSDQFGLKKRVSGGSAANTLVAASQFGAKTFYACKVADDENGHFYQDNLNSAGVESKLALSHEPACDLEHSEQITGTCTVMVTPDAERTMNTYLGITANFCTDELHFDTLQQAQYLYIEGYLVTSDVSRAAAIKAREQAKAHGVKIAMTFSDPAMVTYFKAGITEMLGDHVDILFCNQEECLTFTSCDNLNDAVQALLQIADKLVITLGKDGAMVATSEEILTIPTNVVKAVDTNGAGDMFAGAFMYGVTQGMSDTQAAQLANAAAAEVVCVFGARLNHETHQALLNN